MLLTGFANIVWGTASKFMIYKPTWSYWSLRFLQHKQNFLNHLVAVVWSTAPSSFTQQMFFGCFQGIMAQFELIKHKFLNSTVALNLCGFQITQGVKQCTTCQFPNYHDTTCYSFNCFSHMIYMPLTEIEQNFWYPNKFLVWKSITQQVQICWKSFLNHSGCN